VSTRRGNGWGLTDFKKILLMREGKNGCEKNKKKHSRVCKNKRSLDEREVPILNGVRGRNKIFLHNTLGLQARWFSWEKKDGKNGDALRRNENKKSAFAKGKAWDTGVEKRLKRKIRRIGGGWMEVVNARRASL